MRRRWYEDVVGGNKRKAEDARAMHNAHEHIGLVRGGEETNWVSRNINQSIICNGYALEMHFSPSVSTKFTAFTFTICLRELRYETGRLVGGQGHSISLAFVYRPTLKCSTQYSRASLA